MARNIQISLAGRVQEASAGFRKKQSAYLKSTFSGPWDGDTLTITELRGVAGMQPQIDRTATPSYTPYTDPSMMESGWRLMVRQEDRVMAQSILKDAQETPAEPD